MWRRKNLPHFTIRWSESDVVIIRRSRLPSTKCLGLAGHAYIALTHYTYNIKPLRTTHTLSLSHSLSFSLPLETNDEEKPHGLLRNLPPAGLKITPFAVSSRSHRRSQTQRGRRKRIQPTQRARRGQRREEHRQVLPLREPRRLCLSNQLARRLHEL
ncbi:unnamed protein product [Ectocarpus sp. 12 AP-2014]